jgi:hypothetical protein
MGHGEQESGRIAGGSPASTAGGWHHEPVGLYRAVGGAIAPDLRPGVALEGSRLPDVTVERRERLRLEPVARIGAAPRRSQVEDRAHRIHAGDAHRVSGCRVRARVRARPLRGRVREDRDTPRSTAAGRWRPAPPSGAPPCPGNARATAASRGRARRSSRHLPGCRPARCASGSARPVRPEAGSVSARAGSWSPSRPATARVPASRRHRGQWRRRASPATTSADATPGAAALRCRCRAPGRAGD